MPRICENMKLSRSRPDPGICVLSSFGGVMMFLILVLYRRTDLQYVYAIQPPFPLKCRDIDPFCIRLLLVVSSMRQETTRLNATRYDTTECTRMHRPVYGTVELTRRYHKSLEIPSGNIFSCLIGCDCSNPKDLSWFPSVFPVKN